MAILIAGLTLVIVVVVVELLLWAVFGSQNARQKRVHQRLSSIVQAQKRGHISVETELLRDELLSGVKPIHQFMARWIWSNALRRFLLQAGMDIRPSKVLLMCGVFGLGSYVLVNYAMKSALLGLGAAAVCTFLPLAVVAVKRWRRLRAFEQNFPEAIDLLGRAVRAGHAFTTGLEMIGRELGEPVAGEFRIAFEEQNFGLPLKDALLNLSERVPLIDVRFFVTALMIQKETGGNLAEILDNLSKVIRERFKILGEVRVRTAQGRLTAGMLIALPPAMLLMLSGMNPQYVRVLFTDPWGHIMLAVALGLQIVGSGLLWKIVSIEV